MEIDDDALGAGGIGEFEIVQGEDGKAVMTYTDENGQKVSKVIDSFNLEGASSEKAAE